MVALDLYRQYADKRGGLARAYQGKYMVSGMYGCGLTMAALAYPPSKPLNIPSQPFSISHFMNAAPFIALAPMLPFAPWRSMPSKYKTSSKRALTVAKALAK
jgi:hypothetical protein